MDRETDKALDSLLSNVDLSKTMVKIANDYKEEIYKKAKFKLLEIECEPSVVDCFMRRASFSYLESIVDTNFKCSILKSYNKEAIKNLCKKRGIVNWFTVDDIFSMK